MLRDGSVAPLTLITAVNTHHTMIGGGHQTFQTVIRCIEDWSPTKEYGHESKFQKELADYLDEEMNQSGGGMLGGGMGGSDNHVVSRERGNARGDVVVDDVVGIEMKRNFSNSQKKKLRGQLVEFAENYDYVIALACGIDDMDGWRDLENKFANRGMGLNQTEFEFMVKRRENFGGPNGSGGSDGGILGF